MGLIVLSIGLRLVAGNWARGPTGRTNSSRTTGRSAGEKSSTWKAWIWKGSEELLEHKENSIPQLQAPCGEEGLWQED